MRWSVKAVLLWVVTLLIAPNALGGPIFLTGHDPDFHAQDSAGARNLFNVGLGFATGGSHDLNDGNKFLWVESRISPPGGHRVGELGLGAIGLTLGTHYERANAAELPAVNFSDFTAIAIASSFGGLLGRAELDALISRKSDIENFINAGGGLFAASECFPCGADLLGNTTAPDLFGYLPVTVTSIGADPPFTVTSFGASLGLSSSDLNDPTHNSFGLTGGLNVVDTDEVGNATTLAGNVRIADGRFTVPEPTTLALIAIGLAGVGLGRKKKRLPDT